MVPALAFWSFPSSMQLKTSCTTILSTWHPHHNTPVRSISTERMTGPRLPSEFHWQMGFKLALFEPANKVEFVASKLTFRFWKKYNLQFLISKHHYNMWSNKLLTCAILYVTYCMHTQRAKINHYQSYKYNNIVIV